MSISKIRDQDIRYQLFHHSKVMCYTSKQDLQRNVWKLLFLVVVVSCSFNTLSAPPPYGWWSVFQKYYPGHVILFINIFISIAFHSTLCERLLAVGWQWELVKGVKAFYQTNWEIFPIPVFFFFHLFPK